MTETDLMRRKVARRIALVYAAVAGAWILFSDALLLGAFASIESAMLASALKGVLFVALTSALLYWLVARALRTAEGLLPVTARPELRWSSDPALLVGALGVVLVASTLGLSLYLSRERQASEIAHLSEILSVKARELELWLAHHRNVLEELQGSAHMREHVTRLVEGNKGRQADAIEHHLAGLDDGLGHDTPLLFDAQGRLLAAAGDLAQATPALSRAAAGTARGDRIMAHLIHREDSLVGAPIFVDSLAPLRSTDSPQAVIAVIAIRRAAAGFLFPLVEAWPKESESAETLLVRRDGDQVLFVSHLRHRPGAAMKLRLPLSDASLPAARALKGERGSGIGADYRGVEVLAAWQPIAGTDWAMVAKIDATEALAPVRAITNLMLAAVLVLTAVAVSGVALVWRQQMRLVAVRDRAAALEREALGRHLDLMSRYANDIILLSDTDGRVLEANERAVERYGYAREELIGMPVENLRAPEVRGALAGQREQTVRAGSLVYETTHRTRDGETFPVEVSARVFKIEGQQYFQGIIRDITERKRAEARIERLARLRDALSACNRAIVKETDEGALFDRICAIAVERAGFLSAWIGLADRKQGIVRPEAHAGPIGQYLERLRVLLDDSKPEGQGPIAEAIRAGRLTMSQDFAADPRLVPWHEAAARWGIGSMAAVPLKRRDQTIGALVVYAREPGAFDAEFIALLEEMAGDVSFALETMSRTRERRVARERLELATRGSGLAIWEWRDARDPASFWWSPGVLELLGYGEGELASHLDTVLGIMNAEDRPRLLEAIREAVQTGEPQEAEFRARMKDGEERWFRVRGQRTADATAEHPRLAGTFEDIHARKQAELEVLESEHRFRALIEQSISGIYVIQDGRFAYVNPRFAEILGYGHPDEIVGREVASVVDEHDRATVVENLRRRFTGEATSIAYTLTALRKDGSPVELGVHGSIARYKGAPAVIGLAQDVTDKERAQREIRGYIARLESAVQSTIEVVSTIGELRDPYTHGHERRVGEVAAAIAAEMGLDPSHVEGIRVAGYLHDVGKIAVPAEILAKPSRLSKAEFELVKQHAQQSYDILKGVDFPWPVADAAWQHHERLDGSGYPQGLKDGSIILEARVLGVADVVEAMASHRPYRPGIGIEAALAEIEKNRGRLYDPDVADACLRLFREKGYSLPA